jgi:hypothetical protein
MKIVLILILVWNIACLYFSTDYVCKIWFQLVVEIFTHSEIGFGSFKILCNVALV